MQKLICTWALTLMVTAASAQIPSGYYNSAQNLNGASLKIALYNIIKNHNPQTYNSLWTHFQTTDNKGSNVVWDIYSDKPSATPSYTYHYNADECGNYNSEGDCFNREHSWPASHFNDAAPMYTDLFHLYPTDGYVNNKRGNLPYGKVNSAGAYVSTNGSKVGANTAAGAPASQAFEPIDAYKGDLARTYFYMATRYFGEDATWNTWEMAVGANLKPWAVTLLLQWHNADPVSAKEKTRNDAIYAIQGNRNPFIDSPKYADCIWGSSNCTSTNAIATTNAQTQLLVYPTLAHDVVYLSFNGVQNKEAKQVLLYDMQGKLVYQNHHSSAIIAQISVSHLPTGVYTLWINGSSNVAKQRIVVQH